MDRLIYKVTICIIGIFICGKLGVVFAEGIVGSAHDFSSEGWSGGKICVVCHTPHNANSAVTPLWNHEVTSASYTLYTSSTLQGAMQQPGEASKLCLSCHDGTVAVDSFGGAAGNASVLEDALIGTNLSDDHPVGVSWNHQTITYAADCTQCHGSSKFSLDTLKMPLPFYKEGGRAKVECASCHDPHSNVPDTNGKLLRKPKANSAICLHCHEK